MTQRYFYRDLKATEKKLTVIGSEDFVDFPAGWQIVVTDIKGSTKAVEEGRYKDVNFVAASTIVAACNLARGEGVELPFVFGGDGATILVPEFLAQQVLSALQGIALTSLEQFGLNLRVGAVRVEEVCKRGVLRIVKVAEHEAFHYPIFFGEGLTIAERIIKQREELDSKREVYRGEYDLSGLQCHWEEIEAPALRPKIICLVVLLQKDGVLTTILEKLEEIYGNPAERHPIRASSLHLGVHWNNIKREAVLKKSGRVGSFIRSAVTTMGARFVLKYQLTTKFLDGKKYKGQVILSTDTLKIDGMLKTIMAGTSDQLKVLLTVLSQYEKKGEILFGYYLCAKSVMTCFVPDTRANHIHFVDGSGGGYTLAAKMMKEKIVQQENKVKFA